MKLRTGGADGLDIYVQQGDEPSDVDEHIAIFFDPMRADVFCDIVNEYWGS